MDVYVRYWPLILTLFWVTIGCQGPDPSIELLESELRWMEDQLYLMDRQQDNTSSQLESCQRDNRALRNELARLHQSPSSAHDDPQLESIRPGSRRAVEQPYKESDLLPPEIDLGPGEPAFQERGSGAPLIDPDQPEERPGEAGMPASDNFARAPGPVRRIVLNRQLTGGYDFDGSTGDEGVMIVIEPQNSHGQYLPIPGEISVVVLDPTLSGPSARVARWDFDSIETAGLMRRTLVGRGIHLLLPWPNERPDSTQLRVHVRYTAIDGLALRASQDIRVDQLPGSASPVRAASRSRAPTWAPYR